jgi:cobalt-zinc-cadmium efflux system outer membrane protein
MARYLFWFCLLLATPLVAQTTPKALPDPATTNKVSLEELLAYAEVHAPALILAGAYTKQGDAAKAAAKLKRPENPTLLLGLGPRQGQGALGFDIEASLSQEFELYGERKLRQQAASAAGDVYLSERDISAWEVKTQVRAAFALALLSRQQVEAADKLLVFAESTLEISKKRQSAGDVSALFVKLAEADIAQVKQEKRSAEANYQKARIQLAAVSGWPVATPPDPQGVLATPMRAASLADLLPVALAKQPSTKKNQAEIAAAKAQLALSEREAKPGLVLGASASQESIGIGTQTLLVATFGMSLPTMQKNQGNIAKARTDLSLAMTEGEVQQTQIEAELALRIEDVNAAADSIAAYNKEVLPSLEANLTLLQKAFTLGEIDILQIGAAREKFLQVQRDALLTYAEYYLAVAALELILGTESNKL